MVALTVLFHAIVQSPPFLTIFVGSTALKVISRSPNFLTLGLLCVVESCPLRTASRLMAHPAMTFFHSESGNSGQSSSLTSDCLVALGSTVYVSMSLSILVRVSCKTVHFCCLPTTHAYADLSTSTLFAVGSSSDCCSSGCDTGGLGVRCTRLIALPLVTAASILESWLSTVAMKDLKVTLVLSLSLPSALASFNWISTYTDGLVISPL